MDEADNYLCAFEAVVGAEPFRATQRTAQPNVPGVQTAVVVGPDGQQIHTDKHGRIRVRFHWDPLGQGETAAKRNDELTCWTRVMQPWTGADWGMIAVPRIGQEVVVQFENGDPDRPVIIGMMYNGDTMPPYALPENMTMSGVKTRTLDGGADEFNELVMEDKKGKEYVRLQSQRDYTEIIKNNAVITIGVEHKDPGDLTQTVHNDKTETIGGKSTLTVTGNLTETVEQGNYAHKTSTGKITIEAMQSIELKVAGSTVKIDPSGVTIKGPMIELEAQGMVEVKAPMTTVEGSGLLILKGGLTMIN
jgi:type VI secretion system secreted protein VgrG